MPEPFTLKLMVPLSHSTAAPAANAKYWGTRGPAKARTWSKWETQTHIEVTKSAPEPLLLPINACWHSDCAVASLLHGIARSIPYSNHSNYDGTVDIVWDNATVVALKTTK